jgi:tryptophan synthase alpha chain
MNPSRIAQRFATLKARGKKALLVYLTAGDPDGPRSLEAARAAIAAGADLIEIGVPFSDPIADGPVIQRAMGRALAGGGGFLPALELVRKLRAESDIPIVLFGYGNPLLWYGIEDSAKQARAAGADGLLVVDVPPEEADPWRRAAASCGLDWVTLVAPTSGRERAKTLAETASGFVYVVSMTGVTGGALSDPSGVAPLVEVVRATGVPACIGFGIRDAESAARAARLADGVVVGSAIVSVLESGGVEGPARVGALVAELRRGLDG